MLETQQPLTHYVIINHLLVHSVLNQAEMMEKKKFHSTSINVA